MWKAYFRNDLVIDEISRDVDGNITYERSFDHVLSRHNLLEKFEIHLDNGNIFRLDITKGLFSVIKNNQEVINFFGLSQDKCAQETLSNVRIIYFVREFVTTGFMNTAGTLIPTMNFTALGFQALDKNNRNVQRYLAIYSNGTFAICGEED